LLADYLQKKGNLQFHVKGRAIHGYLSKCKQEVPGTASGAYFPLNSSVASPSKFHNAFRFVILCLSHNHVTMAKVQRRMWVTSHSDLHAYS